MTTWKKRLEPFAKRVEEISQLIHIMDDAELRAMAKACQQPTNTNCGWSTYQAAKLIQGEVGSELYRRKTRPTAAKDNPQ